MESQLFYRKKMVTKVRYSAIENMQPFEAIQFLQNMEKGLVKEVTVLDLLNSETIHRPFVETNFVDLYPRGVYLFFDQNNCIKYVGKTHQGFYTRLMCQLDVTPYGYFGWNAFFRILGGNRTGKPHHELTEDDHQIEFDEVIKYKLVLIDVGTWEEISSDQLKVLEKIIMKAFRAQEVNGLVNTRIGWLRDDQWEQTINELIS
jgi:hypothetical protein